MLERLWRIDSIALGLLLVGLSVAYAVFSHNPSMVTAGQVGLPPLVGRFLHETLGIAVYALLAAWFVLVILLFLRRGLMTWSLRLTGWLLLIPCTAIIGEYLGAELVSGPVTGGGGTLGAWLAAELARRFSWLVRALLLGALVAVGLVLAVDFAMESMFCFLRAVGSRLRGVGSVLRRKRTQTATPAVAVVKPETPPEPSTPVEEEVEAVRDVPAPEPEPLKQADAPAATPGTGGRVPPIVRPAPLPEEERFADFELPPLALLEDSQPFPYEEHDQKLRERAALLEKTIVDFGLNVQVVGINTGPVITQYELALETGLRVNKVTRLADDLALNLKVPSVRMVAPIPGKSTVGVEIPNENRAVVRLKEVILTMGKKISKYRIPLFLGKDTEGRPLVYDLAEMPHLLIAGRTGTGKSVCMNAIILSILMTRRPDDVKMVMIDPKMLEMSEYGKIPHLMHPVVKDVKKAEAILSWAVDKMEERYDLLSRVRVRGIAGYNELSYKEILERVGPVDDEERRRIPEKMPYIIIFVDEMNDLMMQMKKEVESHIIRLAQKSRAAGIHLVVATQKPTVDVITGLIKSNLPARICFQVSSRTDSRVVLDEMGAEKLLGKGDMLFLQPGTSAIVRAQGTYASDREITGVVQHLECDPCYAPELIQLSTAGKDGDGNWLENLRARDELYEQAIEVVVREGRGSVSLLQRALGIGYGRAARLIDFMAEDGIVGNYNGSQAREILYTPDQWEEMKGNAAGVGS